MLHVLPTEVMLDVLSHLPIPSLLSLPVLSHQWLDFFTTNQSKIFRNAALYHEYIHPETLLLEDALSVNTGRPWAESTSWMDFCHRSFQLYAKLGGGERACSRACIVASRSRSTKSTVLWCLPQSYVRPFAHCEHDNGYLVFDRMSEEKEVWRLASDFSTEGKAAIHSPPDVEQMDASACAATVYHQ
ncbi:hypothetical protein EDB92DRAFT_1456535 [Lactarius akahatsu]|uniref:F-box domain-containing protein n=1 Tax=Lactarius akahatsu TaxID=416441 RepID=A0AAD4LE20_9AGAM|nr:hypothetical protein EDB92DRAFT_1456535 [Lactarius akahatsu]